MNELHISNGNSKLGKIMNISLPPVVTCPAGVPCAGDGCYALKIYRRFKNCKEAWDENLELWQNDPQSFEEQLSLACKMTRYFRWHVSGDIPTVEYFEMMIRVALDNPKCDFLAFTKQFDMVNDWVRTHSMDDIPSNLHILFSGWYDMYVPNPYGFATTEVYDPGDNVPDDWYICGGNCSTCACVGVGCWQVKPGETIAFEKH